MNRKLLVILIIVDILTAVVLIMAVGILFVPQWHLVLWAVLFFGCIRIAGRLATVKSTSVNAYVPEPATARRMTFRETILTATNPRI